MIFVEIHVSENGQERALSSIDQVLIVTKKKMLLIFLKSPIVIDDPISNPWNC